MAMDDNEAMVARLIWSSTKIQRSILVKTKNVMHLEGQIIYGSSFG